MVSLLDNATLGNIAGYGKHALGIIYRTLKFFWNISLYSEREKFLWKFFLPYKIKEKNFWIVKDFLKENFWDKIILKKDCVQMWKWISLIDLEDGIYFIHFLKNGKRQSVEKVMKL